MGSKSPEVLQEPLAARGFAPALIRWQRRHGRHHLPWQRSQAALGLASGAQAGVLRDPYRVWLSEVMLQQTQVATVIPYFEAFIEAFPVVDALAAAAPDRVMGLWAGLGYYSRARNLLAAARQVAEAGGAFPAMPQALEALPGVGRSTAAAIAVFGFGQRAAILDGNVKRVLSRVFAVAGDPASSATQRRLWAIAEAELPAPDTPASGLIAYTQGLMDLGAMVCTRSRPACGRCPLAGGCSARARDAVADFPQPKRRKAIPVREVHLLLVRQGAEVLLEARPDSGLWGGLWSLPELPGAPPAGWQLAGGFRHLFTHFRMEASVWLPPEEAMGMAAAAQGAGCLAGAGQTDTVAAAGGAGTACAEPAPAMAGLWPAVARRRWVRPAALAGLPLPTPVANWLASAEAVVQLA